MGDPRGWEALTQQEAEQDARRRDVSFQTQRMVAALAVELPGEVWDDVNERVASLLDALEVVVRDRDQAHDALRYIAGYDVAGYGAHLRPEEVARAALAVGENATEGET